MIRIVGSHNVVKNDDGNLWIQHLDGSKAKGQCQGVDLRVAQVAAWDYAFPAFREVNEQLDALLIAILLPWKRKVDWGCYGATTLNLSVKRLYVTLKCTYEVFSERCYRLANY